METTAHQNQPSPTDISFDEDFRYIAGCQTPMTSNSPHFEQVDLTDDESELQRCRTSASEYKSDSASALRMYTLGCFSQSSSNIAKRRGFNFNLATFTVVDTLARDQARPLNLDETSFSKHDFSVMERTRLRPVDSERPQHVVRSQSLGPLTPPADDSSSLWLQASIPQSVRANSLGPGVTDSRRDEQPGPSGNIAGNIPRSSISMSQQGLRTESDHNPAYPRWLERTLAAASSQFDKSVPFCSKDIISQVLPAHASDQRLIKTYELACDYLAGVLPDPEFTVTHVLAVEKTGGLKELPKSPPSTPSFSNRESYFEDEFEPRLEHQNMFTNIARVPFYHETMGDRASGTLKTQRNVMTAKADMIILERYIPPISASAVKDFFDAESGRSYLADRLHELSLDGSLVLIYPLKGGGRTFQRNYIGPIIDPIVLEMTITRGLTAAAAETVATMSAVDSMLNLEEMEDRINKMGEIVAARSGPRLPANTFVITHSEKAEIILDQHTWKSWYLDQEQSRIKDDIIQYHKEGGRLPDALGRNEEITASIIAREVRDGFQTSQKETGNVPIEIGVFVIRRMRK